MDGRKGTSSVCFQRGAGPSTGRVLSSLSWNLTVTKLFTMLSRGSSSSSSPAPGFRRTGDRALLGLPGALGAPVSFCTREGTLRAPMTVMSKRHLRTSAVTAWRFFTVGRRPLLRGGTMKSMMSFRSNATLTKSGRRPSCTISEWWMWRFRCLFLDSAWFVSRMRFTKSLILPWSTAFLCTTRVSCAGLRGSGFGVGWVR